MDRIKHYTDYSEPIKDMQRITEAGATFHIEFRKQDGTRRVMHRAYLRKQSIQAKDKSSKYKLQLMDMDSNTPRSCYIPLILSVNHIKIKL